MDGLLIHNWEKWQSYRKDRGQPPWIKLHRELMRHVEWVSLSDAERGQLVAIWLLAGDHNGVIPASPRLIAKLCHMDTPPDLEMFMKKGFIEQGQITDDASVTPSRRQRDANMTHQSREEAETEKRRDRKTKAQNFKIPDWIDHNDWMAFEEMRKKIRKPMTDRARANIVKKLEGFRERKLDISTILNNSITAGWQDVYEPKTNGNGSYPKSNEEWQAKGKDLGLNPRGGESWNDFIGRVKAKMEAAHG